MAGTVNHAKLDSPTARAKLKRGEGERGRNHWQTLIAGRAHLGYQRKPHATNGRWLLRRYDGKRYTVGLLGAADDDNRVRADGVSILSYEQAKAKALALLDTGAKPHGRLSVRQAIANYIQFLAANNAPPRSFFLSSATLRSQRSPASKFNIGWPRLRAPLPSCALDGASAKITRPRPATMLKRYAVAAQPQTACLPS
jgi:hypothetical protein